MDTFTDLAFARDAEGIYDLVLDADSADFAVEAGLGSALFISLFSDRRARADEFADAMRRRGWTGDTIAEQPGDRHGSGLWLYEQHRTMERVASMVRLEAEASLYWLVTEQLLASVSVSVLMEPGKRRFYLDAALVEPDGGRSSKTYALADATQRGELGRNPDRAPAPT
jgi:phage gp46-like protein